MTTSGCPWMATTRWCSTLLSPFPLLLPLLLFLCSLARQKGKSPRVATGCGSGFGEEAKRPSRAAAVAARGPILFVVKDMMQGRNCPAAIRGAQNSGTERMASGGSVLGLGGAAQG
jgi:hypothetical protein